jgi:hypothetical protein
MKILIIYEEIPDDTKFYCLDVTDEEWQWIRLTHSYFVNIAMPAENQKACDKLSDFLSDRKDNTFSSPIDVRTLGCMYIVHTGFVM